RAPAFDDNAVGILVSDREGGRHLEAFLRIELALADDLSWAVVIHAQCPLGDIEMVRAPVGHLAAGIIPEETEVVMDTLLVVRPGRSGSEPHVVIELRRGRAVRHGWILSPIHAHQADEHALDFTDATVADVFRRLEELGFGTLLAAALHDAFGLARGPHQRLAFLDEERQRLLAINILARQAG